MRTPFLVVSPGGKISFVALLFGFILSGCHGAPTGCQCSNTQSQLTSPELTCRSTGDPHFTTFSNEHYDFHGKGIHRLAQVTTECGCQVEVQTFMCGCGSGGYFCAPGASANGAVVMRIGNDLKFTFTADNVMTVSGGGFAESVQPPQSEGVVATYDDVIVEREASDGRFDATGWRVHIPGGGSLLVYSFATNSFPTGATVSVWLTVPHGTNLAAESDMCTSPCTRTAPLPYSWCTTEEQDRCFPIHSDQVLFDSALVTSLESTCSLTASSRPPATNCITITNPNRASCREASFVANTQRIGDSYADFYGDAATSAPELCHDKCTPYVPASFSSYVPQSSPGANDAECHCVGVSSVSSARAGATVATLCRRACTGSEDTFTWRTAQSRLVLGYTGTVTGYGIGINGEQRFFNAGDQTNWNNGLVQWFVDTYSPSHCQQRCSALPDAFYFNYYYTWAGSTNNGCGCFKLLVEQEWEFITPELIGSGNDVRSGTVCTAGANCGESSTWTSSQWYANLIEPDVLLLGPTGAVATDCAAWCAAAMQDSCTVKDALYSGGAQLRCGFDSAPAQCALFVGANLDAHLVTGSGSQSISADCTPDLLDISPCLPTITTVCEATGVSLADAEMACAGISPKVLFDECTFDYCAGGGDPTVPNNTAIISVVESRESKNRPPLQPPPPAPPVPPPHLPPPPLPPSLPFVDACPVVATCEGTDYSKYESCERRLAPCPPGRCAQDTECEIILRRKRG